MNFQGVYNGVFLTSISHGNLGRASKPQVLIPLKSLYLKSVCSKSYTTEGYDSEIFKSKQLEEESSDKVTSVYGLPLTPMEYRTFFELEGENFKPEAEYLSGSYNRWRNFDRTMFWLAVISGSLLLVHILLLFILKLRKKNSERQSGYGALTFPRFEIFLVILALPGICEASAALVKGGASSGVTVGCLLLAITSFLLLVLFLFLSIGITFGKLLQYKEVHQEGQKFLWFQEIVRVTLGPGKRGQWTWKEKPSSVYLIIFGPLFEDLRGPPKYMLSQISEGSARKQGERIIDSDDETEDAEAPFIQKLFGILRIYYVHTIRMFEKGFCWDHGWSLHGKMEFKNSFNYLTVHNLFSTFLPRS